MKRPNPARRRLAQHALAVPSVAVVSLPGCASHRTLSTADPTDTSTRTAGAHNKTDSVPTAAAPAFYAACQLPNGSMGVALVTGAEVTWQTTLTHRVHDIVAIPDRNLLCAVARRHGAHAWLLHAGDGRIVDRVDAPPGRHFSGHAAVFGAYLYTTENDHDKGRGAVVVRDLDSLRVIAVWPSGGIGPHQLLADPQRGQLLVANGGRLTNPAYPGQLLNNGAIHANLATLNLHTGTVNSISRLAEPRLSIRHLAGSANGAVLVAQQASGPLTSLRQQWPLLAQQLSGTTLSPCPVDPLAREQLNGYVGSVAISPDGRFACATSPRAGRVLIWSVRSGASAQIETLRDVSGAGFRSNSELILSSGTGQIYYYQRAGSRWRLALNKTFGGYRWDNHLRVAQ